LDGGGGAGIWDLGTTGKTKLNLARQLREVQGWGPEKGYRHWAPQTGHKINKTKAKFFFPLLFFFFFVREWEEAKKDKGCIVPLFHIFQLYAVWAWLGPKGAMKIIIDVGQNFRAAVSGLGPRLFDQKDITSIPWNSRFLLCKYHINTREQPSYERRPQKMALVEGPSWPYPSPSSDSSSLSCICHKATC